MVSAVDMARRLRQLYSLLLEERLIESDSVNAIEKAIAPLERLKTQLSWGYSITRSDPIQFCPVNTKKVDNLIAKLQVKLNVTARQRDGIRSGISELNTTLELWAEGYLIDRWHIDLANQAQEGPKFHLQHGGHSSGNSSRDTEEKLSVPRWMHPPMDVILACELIVANFFPEKWVKLRDNTVWKSLIIDAESFCYEQYFKALSSHYSGASRKETMLQKLWISSP